MRRYTLLSLAVGLAISHSAATWSLAAAPTVVSKTGSAQELAPLVEALRQVGPQGKGHREATKAWADLTRQAGVDELPSILAGMDGANPLAVNWLRAAVDAIAERTVSQTGKLPTEGLEKFLAQTNHSPRARRLAFEWIARQDPAAKDRLIPTMVDDPSLELRREAIDRLLTSAAAELEAKHDDQAKATYQKALASARDLDQVKIITEALLKLNQPVDLPSHYGFIIDWQLTGPFDNKSGIGFAAVYPPEEKVDLKAEYTTPDAKLTWKAHHTEDAFGMVDLNKAIGKHMGVAAYAFAEFTAEQAAPVELRIGSENAVKVWLNGKLVVNAEAYHANSAMDQYTGSGELKPGKNLILVKCLQNEMTQDWAQGWTFQLRVCDASGKGLLSTDRPAVTKPNSGNPPAVEEEKK